MSVTELLDKIPLWGVFLASWMITFLAIQFGLRMGQWKRGRSTREEHSSAGSFVTVSLTLLAFMMAIIFGAVEARFDELKRVVLDEANAIGTAYLRADLLPEADRVEIRQLLYEYVTLRIGASQSGPGQQLEQAIDRSEELHSEMWSRAVAIADQQPTPISALFVQSLNDVIDSHEERITVGIHYRVSGVTWMVLYGLLILAMAMGGYETGLSGRRRLITIALWTALAFSVVLVLVVALDRPHQHLSMATQAAMFDLQEDMRRSMQSQP